MKTINDKLDATQAMKELKRFSILSLVSSIVGLVIFWWLGIAAIAFGARALLLSRHDGKAMMKTKFTVAALAGALIGVIDVILFMLSKK